MCGRFCVADDKDIAEIEKILNEINEKYKGTSLNAKTGEIFRQTTYPCCLCTRANRP